MNINNSHTLKNLTPTQIWDGLLNPSLLIKVLPYAQNLVFLAPQQEAVLNLYSTFGQPNPHQSQVRFAITKPQRPHHISFTFILTTENDQGSIEGQGTLHIAPANDKADSVIHYTISGKAQGIFQHTGPMLLETIGRGFMREMLTGIGSVLRQEELVTPLPTTPPPPTSSLEPWLLASAVALIPLLIAFLWRSRKRRAE